MHIFRALARTPLTAEQLHKLSETFPIPLPTLHRSQARLRQLAAAGQLRPWRYATTGPGGGALYHKLTLESYKLLYGHDATLPTKRFLHEVAISRHHHTRSLADFVVHTATAAHRRGIDLVDFQPENTLRINVGNHALYPDASFNLRLPTGTDFTYRVELDNSTEPVRSSERLDSWQQKLRLYYQHALDSPDRFKLIVVTTKQSSRLSHILELASQLNPNPEYSLVCGVMLDNYLDTPDALFAPCIRDQRNQRVPLLRALAGPGFRARQLVALPATC